LILVAAERARDFPQKPVYLLGTGESERNTAPGGKLPLNTNGGGLSYMHSGMYGMYALQESVRQMRGIAPAKSPRQDIGLPRRRRHVRRLRHDHHVERGAISNCR
jgi:hypothetical protein